MAGQLIHIKGDLFKSDAHIIAHGVNCRGGFGSGVAGQIARQFPQVREAYLDSFKAGDWSLGQVQFVEVHPDLIIANMATQDTYGGPGTGVHVDYEAVHDCFNILFAFAKAASMTVAIPKIGAGLAGGDWERIETIIRDLLAYYDIQIRCYTYET